MAINNNINVRILNIDIHSEINPTNVVLYKDNLDEYRFIIKLIDGDNYYVIPDNTKLTLKLNDIEIPPTEYVIADKYRGTIKLKMKSDYFIKDDIFINSALAHMLTLDFYSESTFGLHQYTITVPFTVVTGQDPGDQNEDSQLGTGNGTTVKPPSMPSPSWNIIQKPNTDQPSFEDILDDIGDNINIVFDGGTIK